ncbi:BMP family ABC transporter substrate-binding protein [Tetragenococcus halophilus]|uniref:BMP family ABC transporter substrate-binding protein n=1 Tax=Tetragenococcus halophilus TaxID=51669 RepID=A0A3G5FM35_TETHA|nr:BMP family ABC transporter substrate-binding protein [Tetragenococcus halophilus]AYW51397.1 BMP family ABC transporter substrate-binding protein [Tetragenococcus halophilus]GBD64508.1 ABC superfamily ATP binding cassette transporter, binding protein [Tetragenococcus halophilus subsp. flandriensis]
MMNKVRTVLTIVGLVTLLSGCSGETNANEDEQRQAATTALITDTNGVDDRSFNQSAWEGMVEWGKENDLEQGNEGYQYFQSSNEADYIPNIDQALNAGFKTIFGIGFQLKDAIEEEAMNNPDNNFVMVDEVIKGADNVTSATFQSNQAAYLAGIAASYTTKTNVVGFIGGVQVSLIESFDAGFQQGVKDGAEALGKDIKIINQYAGAFDAPDKGRTIAQGIYGQDADIIYAAAGATGNGMFQEAKSLNETSDEKEKVWVIGVDRDQEEEGNYTKGDEKANFTLTSTLKEVGSVVNDLATKANKDDFPGGEHIVYGLEEDAVGLTDGNLSDEAKQAVKEAREKIIAEEIKVDNTLN